MAPSRLPQGTSRISSPSSESPEVGRGPTECPDHVCGVPLVWTNPQDVQGEETASQHPDWHGNDQKQPDRLLRHEARDPSERCVHTTTGAETLHDWLVLLLAREELRRHSCHSGPHVEEEEPTHTDYPFNLPTEEEEGQHVEQQVPIIDMHETAQWDRF